MKRITKIAQSINGWLSQECGAHPSTLQWQTQSPLQLQCLEDRVLYSVVPMPVESIDAPAETVDTSDVEFAAIEPNSNLLFSETVAAGVTEILDANRGAAPVTDSASASADLMLDSLEQLTDSIDSIDAQSFQDRDSQTEAPETAAGLVDASQGLVTSGFFSFEEGQSFTINNDFLGDRAPFYIAGFRLTEAPVAGTIYVDGQALSVGEFVSGQSIANDEIVFVPDVSFVGNESFSIESDDTSLNLFSDDFSILYSGVSDDGVVVLGDTFAPVGEAEVVFSNSVGATETQVQSLTGGGHVVASIVSPDAGGVVFQRFDSDGFEVGNAVVVDDVVEDLSDLQITGVADGGFLIGFQGENNDGQQINIRRYDSNGDAVVLGNGSTEFAISSTPLSDDFSLLFLGEDRFLVTNVGQSNPNVVTSVIYDFNGNTQATLESPLPASIPDFVAPQAVLLSDGGFALAWFQSGNNGSATIEVSTFDPGGHLIEENIAIGVSDETEYFSIASTPDNGFIVVWQGSPNDPDAILASRYDRAGNLIAQAVAVAAGSPATDARPDVIALEDGSFVVTFTAIDESGQRENVGQRFSRNLSVFGDQFLVDGFADGDQTKFDLTLLNNGTLVATSLSTESGQPSQVLQQRFEMSVISDGVNPARLQPIIGIDPSSDTEIIQTAILSGLPAGTRVSFGDVDANGDLVFAEVSSAASTKVLDPENFDEILIIPPTGTTGFISGTLAITTNDGSSPETNETNFRVVVDSAEINEPPVQQFDEITIVADGQIQIVDLSNFLIDENQAPDANAITISLAQPSGGVALVSENGVSRLEIDTQQFQDGSELVVMLAASVPDTGETFPFNLTLNFIEPISISGFVANDIDIDGSIDGDQGFENAEVLLFTAELGASGFQDQVLVGSTTTDSQGRFEFTGLVSDEEYFVVVNSLTVLVDSADAGLAWAQQTFASQGAVVNSGNGLETTAEDGYLIGGRDSEITDRFSLNNLLSDSQHVISVSTAGDVTGLQPLGFGFNFNVVNVIDNSDQFRVTGGEALDGQGTLNQFIHNANQISGENRLVFIPTTDTNAFNANGVRWWNIEITELLPVIRDDFTIIDGNAYRVSENGLVRHDPNPGFVQGTQAGQALGVNGSQLGSDDLLLSPISIPDLEISRREIDDSGNSLSPLEFGLKVRGDIDNPDVVGIEISNIAISGFGIGDISSGELPNRSANIVIDGSDENGIALNVSDFTISGNVIGARADFSAAENFANNIIIVSASGEALPPSEDVFGVSSFTNEISGNLIVNASFRGVFLINDETSDASRTSNLIIADNQISSNGLPGNDRGDGIGIGFGSQQVSIVGNYISDNQAIGIDLFRAFGEVDIVRNTISNNGVDADDAATEGGGIRLFGLSNQVIGNTIENNEGPGVHVTGRRFAPNDPQFSSIFNTIVTNEFDGNAGIAIDLSRPLIEGGDPSLPMDFDNLVVDAGDGIDADNSEDRAFDLFSGNFSVDAPEILAASYDGSVLSIAFNGDLMLSGDPNEIIQVFLTQPGTPNGEHSTFLAQARAIDLVRENGDFLVNLSLDAGLLPADLNQPIFINATATLLQSVDLEFLNGQSMIVEGFNTTEFSNSQSLNVNRSPTFADSQLEVSIQEGESVVTSLNAFDADEDEIRYSIDDFGDGEFFQIDANGVLSFISPPDFESPADTDQNNQYSIRVTAQDDDDTSASIDVLVTVTNVNESPVIDSVATLPVPEGTTAVGTITATDIDGDTVVFNVDPNIGDGGLFAITSDGELSFIVAPDFESPQSVSGTNTYTVLVTASDQNEGIATTVVTVEVTNVNQSPTLIASDSYSVAENERFVGTVGAEDGDGDDVRITISGGPDADLFALDGDGNLTFIQPPDFENPADADGDNVYQIEIRGEDPRDGFVVRQIDILVTPENERPVYVGTEIHLSLTQFESSEQSFAIADLFTDPDGDDLELRIAGGTHADLFEIVDNELKLISVPELTGPDSPNYEVQIVASDGELDSTATLFDLTVNNVNDRPEIIQSIPVTQFEQDDLGSQSGVDLSQVATFDADDDAVRFRLDGNGQDNALFEIVGQELVFRDVPQLFGGQQRVFNVTVVVNDGILDSAPEPVTIVVNNINDAPVIENSAPADAIEANLNSNAPLFEFEAFDPDDDEIDFEIAGGSDADLFTINEQGQLFLNLTQADLASSVVASGQLEVQIRATDGQLFSSTQSVVISFPIAAVEFQDVTDDQIVEDPVAAEEQDPPEELTPIPENEDEDGFSVIEILTPTLPAAPSDTGGVASPIGDEDEDFENQVFVISTAQPASVSNISDLSTPSSSSQQFDFEVPVTVSDLKNNDDDAFLALSEDSITYVSSANDQGPELLKQEVRSLVDFHRALNRGELEESLLANYFWQGFDDSETEFMRKNLRVDTTTIVAASAGISLGLVSYLRILAMATTVVTQIPTWKTLDVTSLITAFDEAEAETIHQIVDA